MYFDNSTTHDKYKEPPVMRFGRLLAKGVKLLKLTLSDERLPRSLLL